EKEEDVVEDPGVLLPPRGHGHAWRAVLAAVEARAGHARAWPQPRRAGGAWDACRHPLHRGVRGSHAEGGATEAAAQAGRAGGAGLELRAEEAACQREAGRGRQGIAGCRAIGGQASPRHDLRRVGRGEVQVRGGRRGRGLRGDWSQGPLWGGPSSLPPPSCPAPSPRSEDAGSSRALQVGAGAARERANGTLPRKRGMGC
ncbi:unnamed protein product, partial [Prorocentrum cordatum]